MDVRQTSAFNAMMTLGILAGIVGSGRPWADQFGPIKLARWGIIISSIGFALLGWGAAIGSAPASWVTLFIIGLGNGIFSVSGLSLMMGMARGAYTALFMGAWTVAHALAEGVATASGGIVYETVSKLTGTSSAYATVFFIQAVGLMLCLGLLGRLSLSRFRQETDALIDRVEAE
jgi:MFS transporter, BCD family, chlorophyll transporter